MEKPTKDPDHRVGQPYDDQVVCYQLYYQLYYQTYYPGCQKEDI